MPEPAPLGHIFNEVPTLYDAVRPGYPTDIIDAIVAWAELPPSGKILEIGCGTGQMTVPFATRGYAILALEPGADLAALAVQKCQPYPHVAILQESFESWPGHQQAFDLVLAAQAFHWIEPQYGYAKAAAVLKRGGAIALVWNLDASQHTPFYQATQPLYDTYFPQTSASAPNVSLAGKAKRYQEALRHSDAFADVREYRHAWEQAYAGADYLKLLHTFSDHRSLPEPDKTLFFQAMEEVITRAGGVVHRKYETLLLVARKA